MTTQVAQNFLQNLVGSRLLDLYLKGTGVTGVDSVTMVPLAILFGREAFKTFLMDGQKKQKKQLQMGGGLLERLKIPLLDDPYIGAYLTLLGVDQLTPQTLLPVGLLAVIYEFYLKDLLDWDQVSE